MNSPNHATFRRKPGIFRAETPPTAAPEHLSRAIFPTSAPLSGSFYGPHAKNKFRAGKHQGFCKTIMRRDETSQTWSEDEALEAILPVTTPTVKHGNTYLLISGEIRPGVRTPKIFELTRKP